MFGGRAAAGDTVHDKDTVVSSDDEPLVLVDADDRPLGTLAKSACHEGDGVLHRAFSLFIFDDDGRVLLQRRAAAKPLWPLYWSNSCCSHPRDGESMEDAVRRRLHEELGLNCPLHYLYRFTYQASYLEVGSEHELCSVFAGRTSDAVRANRNEIADCRWVEPDWLDVELERDPGRFTPWLRLEWPRVRAMLAEAPLPDTSSKVREELA